MSTPQSRQRSRANQADQSGQPTAWAPVPSPPQPTAGLQLGGRIQHPPAPRPTPVGLPLWNANRPPRQRNFIYRAVFGDYARASAAIALVSFVVTLIFFVVEWFKPDSQSEYLKLIAQESVLQSNLHLREHCLQLRHLEQQGSEWAVGCDKVLSQPFPAPNTLPLSGHADVPGRPKKLLWMLPHLYHLFWNGFTVMWLVTCALVVFTYIMTQAPKPGAYHSVSREGSECGGNSREMGDSPIESDETVALGPSDFPTPAVSAGAAQSGSTQSSKLGNKKESPRPAISTNRSSSDYVAPDKPVLTPTPSETLMPTKMTTSPQSVPVQVPEPKQKSSPPSTAESSETQSKALETANNVKQPEPSQSAKATTYSFVQMGTEPRLPEPRQSAKARSFLNARSYSNTTSYSNATDSHGNLYVSAATARTRRR